MRPHARRWMMGLYGVAARGMPALGVLPLEPAPSAQAPC